jgi:hypothetical protein
LPNQPSTISQAETSLFPRPIFLPTSQTESSSECKFPSRPFVSCERKWPIPNTTLRVLVNTTNPLRHPNSPSIRKVHRRVHHPQENIARAKHRWRECKRQGQEICKGEDLGTSILIVFKTLLSMSPLEVTDGVPGDNEVRALSSNYCAV